MAHTFESSSWTVIRESREPPRKARHEKTHHSESPTIPVSFVLVDLKLGMERTTLRVSVTSGPSGGERKAPVLCLPGL